MSILVYLVTFLVLVVLLYRVRVFLLAQRLKKQPGVLVLKRLFGVTLITLLFDVVFSNRILDFVPFWSTVRIMENVKNEWSAANHPNFVAIVSVFPFKVEVNCCDGALAREASELLGQIDKMIEGYDALNSFGRNIVTTSGEEWKKHRRVCTGKFLCNFKIVWLIFSRCIR
jgi:hypothetical protein